MMEWLYILFPWLRPKPPDPPPLPPPVLGTPVVDNFDGTTLGSLWQKRVTSVAGWSNGEIADYTDDPKNCRVENGRLVIEARRDASGKWTSGFISCQSLPMVYGKMEARIKPPVTKAVWPAFWLIGMDWTTWPKCGELDILELIGKSLPNHMSIHDNNNTTMSITGPSGIDLGADFHNYWIERRKGIIKAGVDGVTVATVTPATFNGNWIFDDHPMFAIFNVAVSGSWLNHGPPDLSTQNPATMLVDSFKWQPYL